MNSKLTQEEIDSLIGLTKDKLTVIGYDGFYKKGNDSRNRHYYLCKCSCGKTTIMERRHLTDARRKTASCGCNLPHRHGLSKHPAYNSYKGMKGRVRNPHPYYQRKYIENHITASEEWYDYPLMFLAWAEENGFKKGLTLERMDNLKGYDKRNCKWATRVEQQNNRGDYNHMIEYKGRRLSLAQWSRETGIAEKTLYDRLKKMTVEEAFETPVDKSRSRNKTQTS